MDILGRIDPPIEDWERRPDAARWTPGGEQHESKGPPLNIVQGDQQERRPPKAASLSP